MTTQIVRRNHKITPPTPPVLPRALKVGLFGAFWMISGSFLVAFVGYCLLLGTLQVLKKKEPKSFDQQMHELDQLDRRLNKNILK